MGEDLYGIPNHSVRDYSMQTQRFFFLKLRCLPETAFAHNCVRLRFAAFSLFIVRLVARALTCHAQSRSS